MPVDPVEGRERPAASTLRHGPRERERGPPSTAYRASSSATQASRKCMKPLSSRLGVAAQWPQGES